MVTLIGLFMKWAIFRSIYKSAAEKDIAALDENLRKHARAFLKSLFAIPATWIAIRYGGSKASEIVLYVSLATQIAGLAWFVISFAALPQRHIKAAMVTTENMFVSFLSGIIAVVMLAAMTAPLSLIVIVPIYCWLYKAAALYDSADLLKAGKDEQELLAAQATQRMEKTLTEFLKKFSV